MNLKRLKLLPKTIYKQVYHALDSLHVNNWQVHFFFMHALTFIIH